MTTRESLILKSQVNVVSTVQQFTLMVIFLVVQIINYWFFSLYNEISLLLKKLSTTIISTCTIRRVNIFHWKNKTTGFFFRGGEGVWVFFAMIFQCEIGIFKTKLYIEKEGIKNIDLILLYLYIFMNNIYTSGSLWFLCNFSQGKQLCWNVSYYFNLSAIRKQGGFFNALVLTRYKLTTYFITSSLNENEIVHISFF